MVVNYASSPDAAEEVAQGITNSGGQAFVVGANVTSKDDLDAMFKAVVEHWGTVDVLVNNAGEPPVASIINLKIHIHNMISGFCGQWEISVLALHVHTSHAWST